MGIHKTRRNLLFLDS